MIDKSRMLHTNTFNLGDFVLKLINKIISEQIYMVILTIAKIYNLNVQRPSKISLTSLYRFE